VKTVRLYEKIARLRQQMRELAQVRKQLEKQPDKQLSMTDLRALGLKDTAARYVWNVVLFNN
jgi:hypothetical protein